MTDEPVSGPAEGAAGPADPGGAAGRREAGRGDRTADGGGRATPRRPDADPTAAGRPRSLPEGEPRAWAWDDRHGRPGSRRTGERGPRGRRRTIGPRPSWLPEGEPWPPPRRRPRRGFGCLFGFLFIAGVLGLLSLGTSLAARVLEAPGPVGLIVRFASLVVFVAVVLGLARAARAIRRSGTVLDALVDQAARVEAGDYGARVEAIGPVPAPVRGLARGFNTMAARLEANEAQRRTLLADVTHELRTPLAVIQGSVEAIVDGVHPADETHLSAILDETRILDRLIEDLRTLALSESGALSLHREPTDVSVLATDVATSFAATAAAAGIEVATSIDDDLPLLEVDPVRIREVIGNLVANALRHTPPGGHVAIGAHRSPAADGDRGEAIEIVVRDTGSGIDAELLPHVFDRFARGAGSTGSGLGLSIARGLVELHGGTIAASSPAGGGAEIRIRLPDAPPRG